MIEGYKTGTWIDCRLMIVEFGFLNRTCPAPKLTFQSQLINMFGVFPRLRIKPDPPSFRIPIRVMQRLISGRVISTA